MKYPARSKRLSGINVYMTNTPIDIVPMGQVHDWYSLRWQIEILFKTWKLFFHIHHCKKGSVAKFEKSTILFTKCSYSLGSY
ncbi:transposase for insertion sequence element IS231D [Bacillus cereus BAG1X1-2]|nr:transposase for insertion sequence element IS231D [Bacillus cereus BAG1X1-2]